MFTDKVVSLFKTREISKKILFVVAVFVIFRIMAVIPLAEINPVALEGFVREFQVLHLANLLAGGALFRFSIVMLALGPYIAAVIGLQLLTLIFPKLKKMYEEEGEIGRQKFNQIGRVLTVPVAAIHGFGMLSFLQREGVLIFETTVDLFLGVLIVVAGSILLMWLGELITEKGIGNGISLLIFAGIVSMIGPAIPDLAIDWTPADIPFHILLLILGLIIIAAVVIINEARRKIPVLYAKKMTGARMQAGASTYLPLAVNPAGVMPIIFAMTIFALPSVVVVFLKRFGGIRAADIGGMIERFFAQPIVMIIFIFILVFAFTYFYTIITFNPKRVSENLQKTGGYIPGIRPGKPTADYLSFVLNRILVLGAIFLSIIAIIPTVIGILFEGVVGVIPFHFLLGGTGILIVVSVILETMKQIKAQLQMRDYETF
jgi:preprotein translocase subunit SecY